MVCYTLLRCKMPGIVQQALITLHCHLSNCRPFGRQFFCLRRASRRRTLWFQGFSGASFDGIIDGSIGNGVGLRSFIE